VRRLNIIVVLAALTLGAAPTANASALPDLGQAQHTLGVQWLGKTEERLKQGVSLSFNASAYDCLGLGEENLGGSYSAVTGYYPQVPRGTVLDLRIIARGFKKIERVWICVGERAEGKDRKDEDAGYWDYQGYRYRRCRPTEFPGEYSDLFYTERAPLRPIPVQWLIEHRDDRDRYQVVIFTFTWTRGGMMTGSLEINILRGPSGYGMLCGSQILPFLKGFMPIDAVADNNGYSHVVGGQEVNESVKGSRSAGNGSDELPYRSAGNRGNGQTATNGPDIGIAMWSSPDEPRFADETLLDDGELQLAAKGRVTGPDINIRPEMWNVVYILSTKPFEAKLVKDGHDDFQLKVGRRPDGIYWVRTWGRAGIVGANLVVTQDGQQINYSINRSK
jgi:hypothetical protein